MSQKIQPIGDRVLVEPEKAEAKTASGIVLPDTAAKEKPQKGKAVAVGEKNSQIKIGDTVFFKKYSATEIGEKDDALLILDGDDILAVEK